MNPLLPVARLLVSVALAPLGLSLGLPQGIPPEAPAAGRLERASSTASQNRPPTVRASCDPCRVEVGRTSTIRADAQDADGDALTYQWTANAGKVGSVTSRQTSWAPPATEGPVLVTVTVADGRGGSARDAVTITVVPPLPPTVGAPTRGESRQ
jgi:hypothetical protein